MRDEKGMRKSIYTIGMEVFVVLLGLVGLVIVVTRQRHTSNPHLSHP